MKAQERRRKILQIIKERVGVTMGRLARELGVTDRTIRSDIAVLKANHPIETRRGNGGGVKTAAQCQQPPDAQSPDRQAMPNQINPVIPPDNHIPSIFNQAEKHKRLIEETTWEQEFLNRPVVNFARTVWALIEQSHCGRKEFCEKTLLSERLYYRLRDGQVPCPSLRSVMDICIGLNLGGALGDRVLEVAGFPMSVLQAAYRKILYCFRGLSIYECDEILTALHLPSILPKQYRASA